jgi:hypothetical protein
MRNTTNLIASLFALLVGCSLFKSAPAKPPPPPRPINANRTATLNITDGIRVAGSNVLPRGFSPNFDMPPMWLAQDLGIAVAGSLNGKRVVMALSGPNLSHRKTLVRDFSTGTPGRILAVAASPDGMELATAVAEPNSNRLRLRLLDSISGGKGHSVAAFDGDYRVASLSWLDDETLAIVIHRSAPSIPSDPDVDTVDTQGGLYLIGITGLGSVTHLDQIHCRLARLSFSPNRHFAVSQGGNDAAPAVINLQNQSCEEIRVAAPIKILGWAPDSSAFLYAAREPNRGTVGTFRYTLATDLASARTIVVAISSAAVAYASDGTIVALGDSALTWKRVAQEAGAAVKVQVALLNPQTGIVTINSLGFHTPPALLAQSTMVLSTTSDNAAIDTFMSVPDGVLRELIDYSYPERSAFVLASGVAGGPLAMSWSPDGRALAVLDGDATLAKVTVLVPPR